MSQPIAIFYHSLFYIGDPPVLLPAALKIIGEQMAALKSSGLLDAASQVICGINGGDESRKLATALLPEKASLVFHGLQCRNECRTIRVLEEWLPGHEDWYVLYFHSKGATRPDVRNFHWRTCMMKRLVKNWRICIAQLEEGYEAVGCHWFEPPFTPPGQFIFAGNFVWIKARFLKTLPSIMERDRIKTSGIDSIESRYEAEVYWGNGPKVPKIYDYHKGWSIDSNPHL